MLSAAQYNLPFYLQYLANWPEYCLTAEGAGAQAQGYILGKVEGRGENWHGHVTALPVAPDFRCWVLFAAPDCMQAGTRLHCTARLVPGCIDHKKEGWPRCLWPGAPVKAWPGQAWRPASKSYLRHPMQIWPINTQ